MTKGAMIETVFSKRFKGSGRDLKNFGIPQRNMHFVVL
jgi:hypothetical protein